MLISAKSKAFTLIELLVVISIIGILATLVTANLNSARSRARDAARKSDMKNTSTGLRLYFNDKGYFPSDGTSAKKIYGCGISGDSVCEWGSSWVVGSTTYMSVIPKDPLSDQVYRYTLGSAGDTFTLQACLENKSDSSATTTTDTAWCPSGVMFQLAQ